MVGRIPQDFLDQLLSRVDLVDVVETRLTLRKAGREYVACCPFHTEKTPSFTVSPSKQFYHCFGCGAHGNAIGFLMEYERLEFVDAVEELAQSVSMQVPRDAWQQTGRDRDDSIIEVIAQADHYFRRQLRAHESRGRAVDYLRGRGLTGKVVSQFGIGYAPLGWDNLLNALSADGHSYDSLVRAGLATKDESGRFRDRFRDRIMFPIRDRRGRTIAFGARALGDATPKYLNSAESEVFHKGRELYGLYEARTHVRQIQRLIIVEGYLDVIALAQHGLPFAVATLGTSTTSDHVERAFRVTKDVTFCFDGDRAGRNAAWRALENALPMLREGRQLHFLFLPDGEDPDSLVREEGRERFEQRLQGAQPMPDYLFDYLAGQADIKTLDGKARFVEQARPLINRLPDGVLRDLMVQRLAAMVGAQQETIAARLSSPNSDPIPQRDEHARRTPLRMAIALLLNDTGLACKVDDIQRLAAIDVPGMPLLIELIELLRSNPHIKAAALLERYRDTDTGRILERLMKFQPTIANELLEVEFLDILQQLERRNSATSRVLEQSVIQKGALADVSAGEREMIRKLHMAQRVKD